MSSSALQSMETYTIPQVTPPEPDSMAGFLRDFRSYALENRVTSHGTILAPHIPLMTMLGNLSSELLEGSSTTIGVLPGSGNIEKQNEKYYKEFFLKSARFLGAVSLRAISKGNSEFSEYLFDSENTTRVLESLLDEHRQNGLLLSETERENPSYSLWRSAKAHLYSPSEISEIVQEGEKLNIDKRFVRFVLIHDPYRPVERLVSIYEKARKIQQDSSYAPNLTWRFIITTILNNPGKYEEKLKLKTPLETDIESQVSPIEQYNAVANLEAIREYRKANSVFTSGGVDNKLAPLITTFVDESTQIAEKRLANMESLDGVVLSAKHRGEYLKRFTRIAKSTVIAGIKLSQSLGDSEDISLQHSEIREKLAKQLLKDYEAIFKVLNVKRESQIGTRRWAACRADLYSPQDVRKLLAEYPDTTPHVFHIALRHRPFDPRSYIREHQSPAKKLEERIKRISENQAYSELGENIIRAILRSNGDGVLEKLETIHSFLREQTQKHNGQKELVRCLITPMAPMFDSLKDKFDELMQNFQLVRSIPRFSRLPSESIASLIVQNALDGKDQHHLYDALDREHSNYLHQQKRALAKMALN